MKEILYKNNIFIVFSIFFLLLMIGNYYLNRSFVKEVLTNEQLSILKNSSDKIQEWLENKKLVLNLLVCSSQISTIQKSKIRYKIYLLEVSK